MTEPIICYHLKLHNYALELMLGHLATASFFALEVREILLVETHP